MLKLILILISLNAINSKSISKQYKSPEEGDLFEGDIKGIQLKGANQIPTESRLRWDPIYPNNKGAIIPYEFGANYSTSDLDVIKSAFKMVEESTRVNSKDCIKFVPRSDEPIYIRIINSSGCFSYVGKQTNEGSQILSLQTPGCIVKGIVAHEFIHALGFWHEQSRPDRDEYVDVNFENMIKGTEHNFNKYLIEQVDYLNQPYDYDSIMHYGEFSFSVNGKPTIIPKNEGVFIGQRKQLSSIDIKELQLFYNCI